MPVDLKRLVQGVRNTELIVTPKVDQWLMQHGDDPYPEWVVDIIAELLKKKPRVRSGSFSASSAGMCPRRQVLGFLGVPEVGAIDPQLQNIFDDGKWRHLRWQARLLTMGLLHDVEDPLVWKAKRSLGTMDGSGLVYDDHPRQSYRGASFGFELKGVSAWMFPKYKKTEEYKEEHAAQVARYFLMSGFDLFVILYEDKSTQDYFEWVVEPEDTPLQEQREELAVLNKAVDKERLPPVLPSCQQHIGPQFHDCPYGGAGGPCLSAGLWPRIKKRKRKKP